MATSVIKPNNAGVDLPISLPTTGWSSNQWTYSNSAITADCAIEVEFKAGTLNGDVPYIEYEKVSGGGGIVFTVPSVPTVAIPVVAHVYFTQNGSFTTAVDTAITTTGSVESLGANVNAALDSLNSNVRKYIEVGSVNSKSDLDNLMSNLITNNSLSNNKKLARFACTTTFAPFVTGVSYFVDLSASSANYASAIIQGVGYAQMIQATKVPTGWSYELVAYNSNMTYDTLINLQQITSSYVTRNTYNSRKFSDYKMLVFTPYENNWARASCIVPTFVFENATGIDIRYYQGGNLIEVDIKRTSDTSYDAKYIGTPPSGEGIFIYCFGLLR